MSGKELEKEAVESAEKFFGKPTDLVDLDNLRIFKNGYLASAEPREKCIAELEQENKILAQNLEDTEIVNKALEKENAELKRERKRLNDNYHYWNIKACHIDQELYDTKQQLTKAKELLNEFVHHYKAKTIYIENMQDLLKQAEQFLKDCEVEK